MSRKACSRDKITLSDIKKRSLQQTVTGLATTSCEQRCHGACQGPGWAMISTQRAHCGYRTLLLDCFLFMRLYDKENGHYFCSWLYDPYIMNKMQMAHLEWRSSCPPCRPWAGWIPGGKGRVTNEHLQSPTSQKFNLFHFHLFQNRGFIRYQMQLAFTSQWNSFKLDVMQHIFTEVFFRN